MCGQLAFDHARQCTRSKLKRKVIHDDFNKAGLLCVGQCSGNFMAHAFFGRPFHVLPFIARNVNEVTNHWQARKAANAHHGIVQTLAIAVANVNVNVPFSVGRQCATKLRLLFNAISKALVCPHKVDVAAIYQIPIHAKLNDARHGRKVRKVRTLRKVRKQF
jgi:hypothetical protein